MLKKIELPPGINKESTQYAAAGAWYDANNVRFRRGNAEVIGGWSRDSTYDLQGFGRASFSSRDYMGNNYQFVGTDWKYYVIVGTLAYDITPVRLDSVAGSGTTLTGPFTFTNGDPNILVDEHSDHGLSVNDWVVFYSVSDDTGLSGVGVTVANLTQAHGFQVSDIVSSAKYKFYLVDWETGSPIIPNGTDSDLGGNVEYYYKVTSGVSTQVVGQGWGAGLWGGSGTPTSYELSTSPQPITTLDTSSEITVEIFGDEPSSPAAIAVDDQLYLLGLTGTSVGGVNLEVLNGRWWTVTDVSRLVSDDEVKVQIDQTATGSVTGGGTGGSYYRGYNTGAIPPVDPSVDGATRGWGDASEATIETGTVRRVYIDNYGEDLLFANSGGPIYYWDTSQNTSSGVPLGTEAGVAKQLNDTSFTGNTNTPVVIHSFLVSKKDGHCVAFGCNDVGVEDGTMNSLLVRWSDQNNPFDWLPSITNTSGGQVLRVGSQILGGISTKDEVVIFTDAAVYSMRFVGPPDVFSFNLITQGVEIVSSLSAVNASNAVFFMGRDGFYVYTGSVSPLPCPVANYVFDDFNESQKAKCFGAANSAFSEVMWFYPTADSFEPDRFVIFNYEENSWSIGSFDMGEFTESVAATNPYSRTSWRDAIVFGNPMSSYITEYAPSTTAPNLEGGDDYIVPIVKQSAVMIHEKGTSAQDTTLDAYIESGEVDISDGERFSFYSRIIPDLQVFNASGGSAQVTISLNGRDFPGQSASQETSTDVDFTVVSPNSGSTFTPVNNATSIRGRARSVSMRVASSAMDFQWRLGDTRLDMRPDGRR
ncbi:MAG: hypothetical protein CL489_16685 [Acidobacteria bacterium]|nr:hypothetical protein [Acidobacteriota bacterium]